MVRAVHVHAPAAHESLLRERLEADEQVHRVCTVACNQGRDVQIHFLCVDKHLSAVLKGLEDTGLGTDFGSVDIIALESTIPALVRPASSKGKRKYRLTDRRTVREIEETIHAGCHLTFDFILLILVASTIAAVGLVSDSAVIVVASMLVSPMMGPIMAVAFGIALQRYDLLRLGLRNELWGLLLCLIVGALAGLASILFFEPLGLGPLTNLTGSRSLQSEEIESRGRLISLFGGFWTAMPSGVGVALATTNAGLNTLVGVAISSSLLPPLVNAALTLTMGVVYQCAGVEINGRDHHFLQVGFVSFLLFVVNFFTICTFAVLTFRVKGVSADKLEFSPKKIGTKIMRLVGVHGNREKRSESDLASPVQPSGPLTGELTVSVSPRGMTE